MWNKALDLQIVSMEMIVEFVPVVKITQRQGAVGKEKESKDRVLGNLHRSWRVDDEDLPKYKLKDQIEGRRRTKT